MKRCPSCQQMFPDSAPPQCPYDGTHLVPDAPPQQPYYGGGQQNPYGQSAGPPQWQPPGGGGYYPPPYGGQYAQAGGSKALSTAAFACGLGAFAILAFIIFFVVMARSGSLSFDTLLLLAQIIQPLSWLMLLAAVASIVLGVVALVTAQRNPAISKPKAIVGMCLGAIPLLLFVIGLANMNRY